MVMSEFEDASGEVVLAEVMLEDVASGEVVSEDVSLEFYCVSGTLELPLISSSEPPQPLWNKIIIKDINKANIFFISISPILN